MVEVEYTTSSEPGLLRQMSIVQQINTALAVAINVQDYFRSTKYFIIVIIKSFS